MLLLNPGPNILTALLEYIVPFQSKCQHKTIVWVRLSCLLPFCISVLHSKPSYCSLLSVFCHNFRLLYQHFALCFSIFLRQLANCFFAPGVYTASNTMPLWYEHTRLSNYTFNAKFCHPFSAPIIQYIHRFFSKPQ